ncbi:MULTISPECIES: ash family protein [Rahnella]|nr:MULTISPECIES: ash family protein [Rahnella]
MPVQTTSNISMVAQAGLTSVRPVSSRTGVENPVRATTSEILNSGGRCNIKLLDNEP